MKVKNITADLVLPSDVIADLRLCEPEFKSLYAVAFDEKGRVRIWASGNLNDMAKASIALQAKVMAVMKDGQT